MVIVICLLIIWFCSYEDAVEADNKARRHNDNLIAERRHRERLKAEEDRFNTFLEAYNKSKEEPSKITHRRIVKQGDITLGEEIVEEYNG